MTPNMVKYYPLDMFAMIVAENANTISEVINVVKSFKGGSIALNITAKEVTFGYALVACHEKNVARKFGNTLSRERLETSPMVLPPQVLANLFSKHAIENGLYDYTMINPHLIANRAIAHIAFVLSAPRPKTPKTPKPHRGHAPMPEHVKQRLEQSAS